MARGEDHRDADHEVDNDATSPPRLRMKSARRAPSGGSGPLLRAAEAATLAAGGTWPRRKRGRPSKLQKALEKAAAEAAGVDLSPGSTRSKSDARIKSDGKSKPKLKSTSKSSASSRKRRRIDDLEDADVDDDNDIDNDKSKNGNSKKSDRKKTGGKKSKKSRSRFDDDEENEMDVESDKDTGEEGLSNDDDDDDEFVDEEELDDDDEDDDDDEEEEEDDDDDGPTRRRGGSRKDPYAQIVFGGDLRPVTEEKITFSRSDCANKLTLGSDGTMVSGHKGFRSCRVNYGVMSGHWFCEMRVKKMAVSEDVKIAGHVRLGWMQYTSPIEAPVGFHKSGYGYRDVDGSKVNDGLREPYGKSGFGKGDVIGMEIKVDGQDSFIRFYKNGEDQGIAFQGMASDKVGFFATASLYQTSCVEFNPGPAFSFSLPTGSQPLSELAAVRQQAASEAAAAAAAAAADKEGKSAAATAALALAVEAVEKDEEAAAGED